MKTLAFTSTDRAILRLAVPSVISNVTVPLLGLIDLAISGHLGSETYIGAISVGSMIFNVVYWLFGFLRMGTSGLTSQAFGRRDGGEMTATLLRAELIGLALGSLFVLLQLPLWHAAAWAMHPSPTVSALVHTYYNICIWGAPAMMGLYGLNGWFIGMQDTRTPMTVAIAQNVINILASLVLALGMGLKLEGVALGTLIAQWCGFLMALAGALKVMRRHGLQLRWNSDILDAEQLRRFFGINADIFLRTVFLVAVNLFFTAAGARQGDLVLSANALLLTFFTLFSYVMDGFAFAGEALGGRCFGASDREGFTRVVRRLFGWGWALAAVFTLVYFLGESPLMHLLTNQTTVVEAARRYYLWAVLIPLTGFTAFVLDGIFIGMTATRAMLFSSAVAAGVFFGLYYTLFPTLSNHALWLALLAYLFTRGAVQQLWLLRMRTPNPNI